MKRKGAWAGLSYLAGLILSAAFRSELNRTLALFSLGTAIIFFAAAKKYRLYTVVTCVFFLTGIGINTAYTALVYQKLIKMDTKAVTIDGYIKDYKYLGSDSVSLTVKGKIDGIKAEVTFFADNDDYHYCDRVSVTGQVSKITDSITFESESYNYSRSVFLQGSAAQSVTLYGENVNPLLREIKEYRDKLLAQINNVCGEDEAAFLSAMLCADKSEMPQPMKTTMYRSGIGHIFAVSGAHLVIVTTLFSALITRAVKRKRLIFLLTMAQVWGFAAFSGFSVTIVRAAVMMTLTRCGFIFGRKSDCLNSLGISAVLLTAGSPYTAVSPSFVMSFAAVFAVGYIAPKISKGIKGERFRKVKQYFACCTAVMFFTAPFAMVFFGGASVISVISNLLLVPLCTASLQMGFFAVLFGVFEPLSAVFLSLAGLIIKPVLWAAQIISDMPFTYITAHGGILLAIVVMTAFIPLYAGLFTHRKNSFTACALCVTLVWLSASNITRLCSQKGKIVVLPSGNHTMYAVIYDESALVFNINCKTDLNGALERCLNTYGIRKIDCMFITGSEVFTIGNLDSDLSISPDLILASGYSYRLYDNVHYIADDGYIEANGFAIAKTDNGYIVDYNDQRLMLMDGYMYLANNLYTLDQTQFPLEVDLENLQVRRIGYGFE